MTGLAEVFHAHIVDWAYPAHSHDTWAVLIVDHGAIDYSLDTKRCAAVEDTVAILPPGVVHDGQPASRARDGFWKRNLYVDTELLPADLIGPAVDMATVADPVLRRVDEARGRLLDGVPAAQVAVEVGFCDQAHLTRHFKRHTSTTPARYANSGPRRTV